MVEALNQAETISGHNIIGYDIPALELLTGKTITSNVIDTLILAKLAYYDKNASWGFSLDDFGQRLGYPKGHHSDWSKYTPEMEEYCKRDVQVTRQLLTHLKRKTPWLPQEALELEQEVQRIITQQYINGWKFDIVKAKELHIELVGEQEKAENILRATFKPMFIPKGPVKQPKKSFTRLGITTCGEHQPIEYTRFNPSSGNHIIWWVEKLYGKQKWKYPTEAEMRKKKRKTRGPTTFASISLGLPDNPKTDSDTLIEMFEDKDWASPLVHYLNVNKILGQLAEGEKAWLKQVHSDGRLHGGADPLGAVTGRFTHSTPNLAQVPSVRAFKGKESRSLFTVERGYKLVGCDASGLELRTLSHYLARYDGGEYGRTVLEGDIHTANQEAAGLPTRDNAKTFIYAFLYGAGDGKIGTIVDGSAKEGKILKTKFLAKTKGLKQLTEDVKKAATRGYLRGLTGRRLYVRSPHSALNTLLQSAGAYVMKYFVVELDKVLIEHAIDYKFVGNIHDEVQIEVKEEQAEKAARLCEETFAKVTEILNFRILLEGEAKIGNNWADTH